MSSHSKYVTIREEKSPKWWQLLCRIANFVAISNSVYLAKVIPRKLKDDTAIIG